MLQPVSGPVFCCLWLGSLEGPWTWLITPPCPGLSMEPFASTLLCSLSSGAGRWGHGLCCGHPWLMAPVRWRRSPLSQFSGTAVFCQLWQNAAAEKLWHFFCWAAGGEQGPLHFPDGDSYSLGAHHYESIKTVLVGLVHSSPFVWFRLTSLCSRHMYKPKWVTYYSMCLYKMLSARPCNKAISSLIPSDM